MATDGIRVVLFGPPGSGKGTQAGVLSERLGVPVVSTGEMLREAVAAGSSLGRKVAEIMAAGSLVDDDTMSEVVGERLERPDVQGGFLLDGYPRTLRQADSLREMLQRQGVALDAAVLLDVPEEVLVARLTGRGRGDDGDEVVRERLDVYRDKTEPLVDYYRREDLLQVIDGDRPVQRVADDIVASLEAVR